VLWLLQVWLENLLHLRCCSYNKDGWEIYYIYGSYKRGKVNVVLFLGNLSIIQLFQLAIAQ